MLWGETRRIYHVFVGFFEVLEHNDVWLCQFRRFIFVLVSKTLISTMYMWNPLCFPGAYATVFKKQNFIFKIIQNKILCMHVRILCAHKVILQKTGNFCGMCKKTKDNLVKSLMLALIVLFFYTGHTKKVSCVRKGLCKHIMC